MTKGDDPRTEPEHLTVAPKWVPFRSNIAYRLYEAKRLSDHFDAKVSGVSHFFRMESTIAGRKVIVVHSWSKVGKEVTRNEQDETYTRNSVAETIRLVIVEEEGRVYRNKAKEMNVLFADKDLQYQYIDNFVEVVQRNRKSSDA
ncbi:UDP-glycosyltransferase [Melia azedarach]|uniref:UDP-glycosyltransferase n=1 Tax=Melia azedarach TaxID=155640 RepID=A0ACC1XT95_MELAZ|nr:UDP-glycosyltransferase [Melia azedarach]